MTIYRAILLLSCAFLSAQMSAQTQCFIQFDSKSSTPYSVDSPADYLGQRAIDRREQQGIDITSRDLPVDPAYLTALSAIEGVTIKYPLKWFNGAVVICDESVLDEIEALDFVMGAEGLNERESDGSEYDVRLTPFDSQARSSSALSIEYGQSADQILLMNGQVLHDLGYEGQGMVMAILDSGFDNVDEMAVFEPARSEGRILSTIDIADGDLEVYDEHSHGRFVLSCIAADVPGEVYGTANKAQYHLIRTEEVSSESRAEEYNWVAGAEYADSVGADVLNTSLGYTTFDEGIGDYDPDDLDGNTGVITIGADLAAATGMLVINSAGNSGNNSWGLIGLPADGDSVLAIGAVDSQGVKAGFSSFGPSADGRIKPNVMAMGQAATVVNQDDVVMQANGTSFSSPILAGMATCLWQAVPTATNMQVFKAIEQSAHLYDSPTPGMGHGIPDFGIALDLLQDITSIEEYSNVSISLFPNPAEDQLVLTIADVSTRSELSVDFFTIDGRSTERQLLGQGETHILPLSGLTSGLYVIRLFERGELIATDRVVVQ